ncbi:MAG: ATP-binding protein, partial [Bacteroidota bacterium]
MSGLKKAEVGASLCKAILGAQLGNVALIGTSAVDLVRHLFPKPTHQNAVKAFIKNVPSYLPDAAYTDDDVALAQKLLQGYFPTAKRLLDGEETASEVVARMIKDGEREFWTTPETVALAHFAEKLEDAPVFEVPSRPRVDQDGRDRIRKMLEGVVQAYQERDDVREAVERLNRTDVRTRLEALQASSDATATQLDRLHETLGFLVQADLLYNPRYELTAGTLERARREDEDGESIAALLNARAEVVRFTGRAHERSELRAFCDTSQRFAAVFVSGPGGVGKTRLAMQAVEDADDSLWRAGFLRRNAPNDPLTASELRRGLKQLDAAGRDLFLVIDYAEERPDFVAEIVRMWTDKTRTLRQKLRLVLLCRNRDVVLDAVKRLEPDVDTLRGAQAVLRDSLVLGMQNPLAYHEGSAESAED